MRFTKVEMNSQDSDEVVMLLEGQLDEARSSGAANELDEVLTGIESRYDIYPENKIIFNTFAALFPKQSLMDSEIFKHQQGLFTGPYLSELSHVYTGNDIKRPDKVLVHVRSNKMFQGNEQVSVSHAGYVKYEEHPSLTSVREFKEELKRFRDVEPVFVDDAGGSLKEVDVNCTPACLDCTLHYMGPKRIRNPVLGFVQYVEPKTAERYPSVSTLDELNELCTDTKDLEVLGTAWIPYDRLDQFWGEVEKTRRVYSISHETTLNFKNFFDNLK
jgi:hypothetical protein